MRHRHLLAIVATFVAVATAGCSSGASTTVAPSTGGSVESAAAPSSEASSAAVSETPSEAASTEPSFAIPSFTLPSSDKALEALIPDQICGTEPLKGSLTGEQVFAGSTKDAAVVAALQSMGKTKADVSAAFGITTSTDCGVAIIRVNGASESDLKRVFLASAASSGTTYTEDSVGGKAVLSDDPTGFSYTYFKGDGIFTVKADTKQHAADILSAFP